MDTTTIPNTAPENSTTAATIPAQPTLTSTTTISTPPPVQLPGWWHALQKTSTWITIVSAILTVAVALGVPMTAAQQQLILSAVGLIVALVLGHHWVLAKVSASLLTAQADQNRLTAELQANTVKREQAQVRDERLFSELKQYSQIFSYVISEAFSKNETSPIPPTEPKHPPTTI